MSRRYLIWFWSGGGGGSQFALRLARRLALRFGAEAVTLSLRADDPTLAQAEGLDARAADVVSNRHRPLQSAAALAASAKVLAAHAHGADVVILPMNFAAASPLSLTLRKPLVYCAHDPAPHPGDYAVAAQFLTQRILLARASRVVALSDYAANQLASVRGKLKIVPLSAVFEPQPPAPGHAGPARLLFAGRMIAYKGADILADALGAIAARTDWRMRVAGDGPALTPEMLARFAHPQIDARRVWLADDELEHMIRDCDLLLAPYHSATQSGVIAQALTYGVPTIVTPVGALAEQIGQGRAGWVAAGADASSFAAALTAALDDPPARAAKSLAARALGEEAWRADHWGWLESERF